jgi:lipoprotein NlpI
MLHRLPVLSVAIALFFLQGAQPASAVYLCNPDNGATPDVAIEACNAEIAARRALDIAYYDRGLNWNKKKEWDKAIGDFNQALKINPKYQNAYISRGDALSEVNQIDRAFADYNRAIEIDSSKAGLAYYNRGNRWRDKGDSDKSIADYSKAIELMPKYANAFAARGDIFLSKGDNNRALADYSEALNINPKNQFAILNRAVIYFYTNDTSAKALLDLNRATEITPTDAYAALWVDIASQRSNLPSRLPQTSSQIDMTVWPAPVVRLFMGQITVGALLAAADDPNAAKKTGQICEAKFYTGELSLVKGSKKEATRLFRLAASDCPHSFIEWYAANAELKALGASP